MSCHKHIKVPKIQLPNEEEGVGLMLSDWMLAIIILDQELCFIVPLSGSFRSHMVYGQVLVSYLH